MSPWPRPFITGMPAPRWRNCLPDWMPAGMLDLVRLLVEARAPRCSPPSAAVVKLTGQRANRVVPSRWKIGVAGEVDEDVEIAGRAAAHAGLAFAGEADAGALVDPGGDVDRERLALLDPALAAAGRAGIGDHLADAAAGRAGLLDHEEALAGADLAAAAAGGAGCAPTCRPWRPSRRRARRARWCRSGARPGGRHRRPRA